MENPPKVVVTATCKGCPIQRDIIATVGRAKKWRCKDCKKVNTINKTQAEMCYIVGNQHNRIFLNENSLEIGHFSDGEELTIEVRTVASKKEEKKDSNQDQEMSEHDECTL